MAQCPPSVASAYPSVQKAAGAVLDYGFDLAPVVNVSSNPWAPPGQNVQPWLSPGEVVLNLVVTLGAGSVSKTQDLILNTTQISPNLAGVPGSLLTAWISGGIPGNTYLVTYTWVTNSSPVSREDDRILQIVCTP